MCQQLQIFGRKLVVLIAIIAYSLHYQINMNVWIQTDNFQILDYLHFILTNISFIMLVWCFCVMLIVDPGRPKKADEHTFQPFTKKGFCQNCKSPKPERCHHCSVCERCVLQMDHHCPWINTCVGYQNRKQFILLLFYALFFNFITILGTTKTYLFLFHFTYLNLFQALICIGNYILVFLLSQFFKYHIELLCRNQTTLEDIICKANTIPFNIYDIDQSINIRQIFGSNKLIWFFPIYSGEGCDDGNSFPQKNDFKLKQAPPPQVTQILYEQQVVSSDKKLQDHPKIEILYRREMEKQKFDSIIKV